MNELLFDLGLEQADGVLRVLLSGALDLAAEEDLVATVSDLISATDASSVVVDLSAVTFMDSSGLRAVLLCRAAAERRRLPFALAVVKGPVTRLLDAAGVRSWFGYESPPQPDR